MVVVTTKTINFSIKKGSRTNSVNATIMSTPGVNMTAFKKPVGIVKIIQLILTLVALACLVIAINRNSRGPYEGLMRFEVFLYSILAAGLFQLLFLSAIYLSSTTSWILITRTTSTELVFNIALAVFHLIAGIIEIVFLLGTDLIGMRYTLRLIGGAIAIVLGVLYVLAFALARSDLKGRAARQQQQQGSAKQQTSGA